MAGQSVYVCMPWDQHGAKRPDREKGWKLEAVWMDMASPTAQRRRWAREGREEIEGRKRPGQKHEGADRLIKTRKEHTWMWQASMKSSGKTVWRSQELL